MAYNKRTFNNNDKRSTNGRRQSWNDRNGQGGRANRSHASRRYNDDFEADSDFDDEAPRRRTSSRFSDNSGSHRPGRRFGNSDDRRESRSRSNSGFAKRSFSDDSYDPNAKYSLKKQLAHKAKTRSNDDPVRLNKFIANAGLCSRREADTYIEAGVVTVNGEVVTELGYKVIPSKDKVMFHNEPIKAEKMVYVLLNKPKDCVTTTDDPHARITVMDIVKNACKERIYPVGRLDRNTTGVLLLTNDGDLAAKLMHPKYNKKKIYQVTLDNPIREEELQKLRDGVELDDGRAYADEVDYIEGGSKKEVGIEIHSGRNRIVRRMFEHLGYKVMKLDRVYFAGLTKKNLPRGTWRFLTQEEINYLKMGRF